MLYDFCLPKNAFAPMLIYRCCFPFKIPFGTIQLPFQPFFAQRCSSTFSKNINVFFCILFSPERAKGSSKKWVRHCITHHHNFHLIPHISRHAHLHIRASSHLHILKTCTSAHLHDISPSHLHIFTSHLDIRTYPDMRARFCLGSA